MPAACPQSGTQSLAGSLAVHESTPVGTWRQRNPFSTSRAFHKRLSHKAALPTKSCAAPAPAPTCPPAQVLATHQVDMLSLIRGILVQQISDAGSSVSLPAPRPLRLLRLCKGLQVSPPPAAGWGCLALAHALARSGRRRRPSLGGRVSERANLLRALHAGPRFGRSVRGWPPAQVGSVLLSLPSMTPQRLDEFKAQLLGTGSEKGQREAIKRLLVGGRAGGRVAGCVGRGRGFEPWPWEA